MPAENRSYRTAASLWKLAPADRIPWLVALLEAHRVEEAELRLVRDDTIAALVLAGQRPAQVARDLHISRETLYKQLRRSGVDLPDESE